MEKNNLTYFYTENYLNYIAERFIKNNESYTVKNNEYKFFAPILHSDDKVESGELSYLSLPYVSGNISDKTLKKEMATYFEKINSLGSKRIALRQDPLVNYNNQIIKSILQEGFEPNLFYTTIIDLNLSQEILWQNVRKRYKSFINGLEKNTEYKTVIVDSQNNIGCIEDWIDLYMALIKRGGGCQDRNRMKNVGTAITENCGLLYLLYKDKQLISGLNINYANKFSYYTAGGTHPDFEGLDNFSHYLMWYLILDLKNRGLDFLEIGPVFYKNVKNFYNHSEKELTISDFKLGMGGKLTPFFIFEKINETN